VEIHERRPRPLGPGLSYVQESKDLRNRRRGPGVEAVADVEGNFQKIDIL
jgi:hypothetical protein